MKFESTVLMYLSSVPLHKMKTLIMVIILSVISLPGTKADCSSEIISGRITFSLFAKTFDAILLITLQRLMGRNCPGSSGVATFVISTIKLLFMLSWLSSLQRIQRTARVTSSLHKYHCFWKNCAGKPSGPGAFKGNI
jgi:hypothetical protein